MNIIQIGKSGSGKTKFATEVKQKFSYIQFYEFTFPSDEKLANSIIKFGFKNVMEKFDYIFYFKNIFDFRYDSIEKTTYMIINECLTNFSSDRLCIIATFADKADEEIKLNFTKRIDEINADLKKSNYELIKQHVLYGGEGPIELPVLFKLFSEPQQFPKMRIKLNIDRKKMLTNFTGDPTIIEEEERKFFAEPELHEMVKVYGIFSNEEDKSSESDKKEIFIAPKDQTEKIKKIQRKEDKKHNDCC